MSEDPYSVLGVKKEATPDEIRAAYRKLAKTLHPDLNPGDRAAEEKFKAVAAAYDLVGDPEKRARYDRGEIDASGTERPRERYYRDFQRPRRRGAFLQHRQRLRRLRRIGGHPAGDVRQTGRRGWTNADTGTGCPLPASGRIPGGRERSDQAHHHARGRHHRRDHSRGHQGRADLAPAWQGWSRPGRRPARGCLGANRGAAA